MPSEGATGAVGGAADLITRTDRAVLSEGARSPIARRGWSARSAMALVALGAAIWAAVGSLWLFPLLSDNADEGAYLTQSASLSEGDLLPRAPAHHADAFHPWFSVLRDGHFIYKYTPVHAALLATGRTVFGSERVVLPFIALAVVALLALVARELGASPVAAAMASVVFVLSPLWIIQSATFLPYVSNLVWLLAFLFCFLRATRLHSPSTLALAGLFAGIAFFARPFEAILIVVTMLVGHLWRVRFSGAGWLLRWLALGALPGLALFFAYNAMATGSPFRPTFQITGASDTLGFGTRSVRKSDFGVDYTLDKGVGALTHNMALVITWTFGSFLGLVLAVLGFARRRDLRGRTVLSLLLLVWPLGFFFFWGAYASVILWDVTKFAGPFYYLPMLVALAIGAGVGIVRLARGRVWLGALVFAGMAAITSATLVPAVDTNLSRTAKHQVIEELVHARLDQAPSSVLFVPPVLGEYLQSAFPFLRNETGYDGHVVFALGENNREFGVMRDYPHRRAYTLSIPSGYGVPAEHIRARIDRLQPKAGSRVSFSVHVSAALVRKQPFVSIAFGDQPVRVHLVDDPSGGARARLTLERGTQTQAVHLASPDDASVHATETGLPLPLRIELVVPVGDEQLVVASRMIPARSDAKGITILSPGEENVNILTGADRWSLTTAASR